MSVFKSVSGQSIFDVCLNTYGNLDNVAKLAKDSGLSSLNSTIKTGTVFQVDETILLNDNVVNPFPSLKYLTATIDYDDGYTAFETFLLIDLDHRLYLRCHWHHC